MSFHGEVEQYSRNYSHRLYHLEDPDDETAAQCEDAVVKLFQEKIQTQKGSNERFITARTQYADFRGNYLRQATKRHLHNN